MKNLPARLADRLSQPLPGYAAQVPFAPELSYGRHFDKPAYDAQEAAVVALLYPHNGAWYLPLIVRAESVTHHAGQVSLPGGRVEPGETSREAAVREMHEELGVLPEGVRVLGALTPVYVFSSNFNMQPWLAVAAGRPEMRIDAREVSQFIELPLSALADRSNFGSHRRQRGEFGFVAPHFDWREQRIWGATLLVLGELAAICDDLLA